MPPTGWIVSQSKNLHFGAIGLEFFCGGRPNYHNVTFLLHL